MPLAHYSTWEENKLYNFSHLNLNLEFFCDRFLTLIWNICHLCKQSNKCFQFKNSRISCYRIMRFHWQASLSIHFIINRGKKWRLFNGERKEEYSTPVMWSVRWHVVFKKYILYPSSFHSFKVERLKVKQIINFSFFSGTGMSNFLGNILYTMPA